MNTPDHSPLSALRHMPTAALVAEWTQTFGGPPALTTCREFLLVHARVAPASGAGWGLEPRRAASAEGHQDRPSRRPCGTTKIRCSTSLTPGTVLLKTWQGQRYTVTVVAEGYQFQGQRYASLSEIARRITGTR